MKTLNTNTTTEPTQKEISEVQASFCPFEYLDIEAAIDTAKAAGYKPSFVNETVEQFADEIGLKLTEIDPNYCVYEQLLQEAREEIELITGYDFINDNTTGEIHTLGNYLCTSYDYTGDSIEELKQALKQALKSEEIETLREATQWFLNELEISI